MDQMSDHGGQPVRGGIVVGVDGSEESKDALRWAVRQAEVTGAPIHAVTTWHIPPYGYSAPGAAYEGRDFAQWAKETLEETVNDVGGEHPKVTISTSVEAGPAAAKLLEASAGADLLVVGSRGHGAFAGMLLGSVSEHCVTHAQCPVVVVRRSPADSKSR
jgi:nucleotide-binding universal stress UspA family protein